MLSVSILMYRAEGCAVLRRAELRCAMRRLCSIALWIDFSLHPSPDRTDLELNKLELPEHIVAAQVLINRGDMPGGRAADRPK